MSDKKKPFLIIQSHKGPYQVYFEQAPFESLEFFDKKQYHIIIDQRVYALYQEVLSPQLLDVSVLQIEANEPSKTLDRFTGYVEELLASGVKRGHSLVAIGGGVIQDIVCFLAATLFRGLDWTFFPTTLLAQADSCIGSKSSINVGATKNMMGTFTPPQEIYISTDVLQTLDDQDMRSGIGEMLKVHAIDGPESFDRIAADYDRLNNKNVMEEYLVRSLKIKRKIIEVDEFDRGVRNVMNYGHSFGHAIEAATGFKVPHGIAVCMGMDMANYISVKYNRMGESHFHRMHPICFQNYHVCSHIDVPFKDFFSAIRKDKKNTDSELNLILPNVDAKIERVKLACDDRFQELCREYFQTVIKT